MAIKRIINGLRISWPSPDSLISGGIVEPVVNIMGTISDDVEQTTANASWTFKRSDLSPSQKAKLDAFLADVLGHAQGKLGGRPITFPA